MHLWLARIEFGGLLKFLRFTALSIVLLALGAMVSWTTNVAEVAPAVATLGRPLRWLRLPVDDWAVALALALRAFPMLIDEFRCSSPPAGYGRGRSCPKGQPRRRRSFVDLVDLLAAGVTVALRRADEMGDAITARGGTGQSRRRRHVRVPLDGLVLAVVAAAGAVAVMLEMRGLGGTRGIACRRERACRSPDSPQRRALSALFVRFITAGRRCWPPVGPRPRSQGPERRPRYISSKNGLMAWIPRRIRRRRERRRGGRSAPRRTV